MNPELEAVRSALTKARLKILSGLNAIAVTIGGGILALHLMYPNAIGDFSASLSPTKKLIALIVWSSVVQFFIHRTKKAA